MDGVVPGTRQYAVFRREKSARTELLGLRRFLELEMKASRKALQRLEVKRKRYKETRGAHTAGGVCCEAGSGLGIMNAHEERIREIELCGSEIIGELEEKGTFPREKYLELRKKIDDLESFVKAELQEKAQNEKMENANQAEASLGRASLGSIPGLSSSNISAVPRTAVAAAKEWNAFLDAIQRESML